MNIYIGTQFGRNISDIFDNLSGPIAIAIVIIVVLIILAMILD